MAHKYTGDPVKLLERVEWLCQNQWHGDRRAMYEEIKVSEATLQRLLRDGNASGWRLISQLVRFGVNQDWLRYGEGEPFGVTTSDFRLSPLHRQTSNGSPILIYLTTGDVIAASNPRWQGGFLTVDTESDSRGVFSTRTGTGHSNSMMQITIVGTSIAAISRKRDR